MKRRKRGASVRSAVLFICVTVVMVLVFEETYFNCSTRDPYDVEQLLLMSLGGSYTTRSSQHDPENLHELLVVETIKHDFFSNFWNMRVLGLCFPMSVRVLN